MIDPAFNNLSAEEIYARLLQRISGGAGSTQQPQTMNATGSNAGGPKQASSAASPDLRSGSSCQSVSKKSRQKTSAAAEHTPGEPGAFGEVWDATDEGGNPASPAEMRRQEREWAIAAEQALRAAKACGIEPGGVERPLSESRQSQQDWRAILRDFIAATTPADYRWTPPNRRYIASGLYLPSVECQGVGEIVIAVDTSGSIGRLELAQFAGEISAISEETRPEAISSPVPR